MTNEDVFRRVTDALRDLATVRHTLVEMQEELQKERVKSRWTEKDVADAQAFMQLMPDAVYVRRIMGTLEFLDRNESIINDTISITNALPRLKNAQKARLDDIVGDAGYLIIGGAE